MWFYFYTRSFFRSFMRPIPGHKAKKWHRRMQLCYVIVATNIAAYTYYQYTQGSLKDRSMTEEEKLKRDARLWNMDQATVYQFKNGSLKKYDIDITNSKI